MFGIELKGHDDAEPLFTPDDYVVYDKYCDGDPYDDENYIAHFRTILSAMNNGKNIKREMMSRRWSAVFFPSASC